MNAKMFRVVVEETTRTEYFVGADDDKAACVAWQNGAQVDTKITDQRVVEVREMETEV